MVASTWRLISNWNAKSHRLDGRSDVFSLGVILYEALTGQRPFRGSTLNELLHQIVSVEPRTPRGLREDIPAELERICLKALNKRLSDRYASAAALAEDLEAWLQPKATQPIQLHREEQIVPKGLRSFDASDASSFWIYCLVLAIEKTCKRALRFGNRELNKPILSRHLAWG